MFYSFTRALNAYIFYSYKLSNVFVITRKGARDLPLNCLLNDKAY